MDAPPKFTLDHAYREAREFARRFKAPYLVYRPVTDEPHYYGIMSKTFFDLIKVSSHMKSEAERILKACAVIVSPDAS